MNEYDYLILLTLSYSSCFTFALTIDEIKKRLPLSPKKTIFSEKKIKKSLTKLLNHGLIKNEGIYFYLRERDLHNRISKEVIAKDKKNEVAHFVDLAKKISFVKAIILTGSTAVNNAKKYDDLDFMIICQKNTLWVTRLLLILLTKIKGKQPSKKNNNAWCLNLWLDESDLTIDKNRRSLYEAYEILQMNFVFDRNNYQQKFLNANSWLKDYLFFYHDCKFAKYKKTSSFSLINWVLFFIQKKYRRFIFGQENFTLTLTQAFFNHLSFRKKLFTKLRKRLSDLNMT